MRHLSRRVRVLSLLLVWLVVAAALTWAQLARAAGEFTYDISLNYQLDPTGTTAVSTHYQVTYNTSNRVLASLKISAPTNDVRNLRARYADGTAIPLSSETLHNDSLGYSYDYKEITLTFDRRSGGRGSKLDFILSYDTTDLMDVKGSSKTFYVPSLAQLGDDEIYHVSVSVPQGFGKLYSTGIQPKPDGTDGTRIRYAFSKPSELKKSPTLIFGDTTVYKVDFAYPLKNTTPRPKTVTVTLPPDTSSQKIFINSLDPAPTATRLDPDGNILADFLVPAHSDLVVHTDIAAQIHYLEYDLEKGGVKADIPADLVALYTKPTRYWQSTNPDLQVKAKQAVVGTQKVVDTIRNLHKLTIDTLTYNNEKIKYNIRQGSSKALSNPDNAVCLEYSDLMIALLRSQGIPARMPVGYAYAGSLKQSKEVSDSLHSWVEAYVPGVGWINLDPTWGEKYDTFGKSDLDHFAFALWGRDDAMPAAVMEGTQDQNYQYENTKISYASDFPSAPSIGRAVAEKYIIFPGISLVRYTVTAPEHVPGDKYAVALKQGKQHTVEDLGSLAPRQVASRTSLAFGGDYGAPAELLFSQATDSERILAAATGTPVWWPCFIVLGVLSGIVLIFLVKWGIRRRRRRIADLEQKTAALQDTAHAADSADVSPAPESSPTLPASKESHPHHDHPSHPKHPK